MKQNYIVHFTRAGEEPRIHHQLIISMAEDQCEAIERARKIQADFGWKVDVQKAVPTELEIFSDPRENCW